MKKNLKSLESLTNQLFKAEKNFSKKSILGGDDRTGTYTIYVIGGKTYSDKNPDITG